MKFCSYIVRARLIFVVLKLVYIFEYHLRFTQTSKFLKENIFITFVVHEQFFKEWNKI